MGGNSKKTTQRGLKYRIRVTIIDERELPLGISDHFYGVESLFLVTLGATKGNLVFRCADHGESLTRFPFIFTKGIRMRGSGNGGNGGVKAVFSGRLGKVGGVWNGDETMFRRKERRTLLETRGLSMNPVTSLFSWGSRRFFDYPFLEISLLEVTHSYNSQVLIS